MKLLRVKDLIRLLAPGLFIRISLSLPAKKYPVYVTTTQNYEWVLKFFRYHEIEEISVDTQGTLIILIHKPEEVIQDGLSVAD